MRTQTLWQVHCRRFLPDAMANLLGLLCSGFYENDIRTIEDVAEKMFERKIIKQIINPKNICIFIDYATFFL